MKAVIISLGLAFLAPLVGGCALKETSAQLEEAAYLVMVGDLEGTSLQIGDNAPIPMEPTRRERRYEIPTGRNRVRVWRGEEIVVDRDVFVSRGQVFRLRLP